MAESKNTFIKSKMNQDLDSRLIPNGEYREAFNIGVSQSEGSDVGTLKTILGNLEITDFGFTNTCNVEIIGYCIDDENNSVYLFFTNFVDTSSTKLDNYPSNEAICQIWRRDVETNTNTKLVEGKFLNFSLTHPITGVNILEDLLFWTDNRNQPRKININKANPGGLANPTYYTNDDQINVIKYYPHNPISLINNYVVDYTVYGGSIAGSSYTTGVGFYTTGGTGFGLTVDILSVNGAGQILDLIINNPGVGYINGDVINIAPKGGDATITLVVEEGTTMKDKCSEKLPVNSTFSVATLTLTKGVPIAVTLTDGPSLTDVDYTGALVKITGGSSTPNLARVTAQTTGPITLTIDWPNPSPASIAAVTQIEVGINPDYEADWPGDCEYLKDKFVRFAYRFRFDDNERSLMSPFTQACFIPKQNGYFLSQTKDVYDGSGGAAAKVTINDTAKALESTEVEFCENAVTNVDLLIPCPIFLDPSITGFNNLVEQMHVTEIEIIYKNDAEDLLKVVDVIDKSDFTNINASTILYSYQSRKPIKVLPESELTRVSDKVPLRALTQEISGNRVMYGNYIDGHSSLNSLNYEVNAGPKFMTAPNNLRKEYQNHTLKQNRNYQVGVVLVDRYGRSSDVILSSLDESSTIIGLESYLGSTLYHPYKPRGWARQQIITDSPNSTTWPGDTLNVKFNEVVPTNPGIPGYPGLFIGDDAPGFSNLYGGAGYATPGVGVATTGGSGVGLTVNYTAVSPPLKTTIISITINNPGTGYEEGDIITIPGGTPGTLATFIYRPSQTPKLNGWYSYKIVVKQQEQDYYNVYLPGIVNGAINTLSVVSATEATISLFSDNINKVPRDLTEVGPTQKTFNSTVELSLRVTNDYQIDWTSNQFYPTTNVEQVQTLSELTDLGFTLSRITKDINTVPTTTSITYNNFSENIQAGMSVVITSSAGAVNTPLSEGVYVTSTYINAGSLNQVNFNKAPSAVVNPADTITFGPPGIVYNSNNNPLIGILSTSQQIGIAEEDNFVAQLAVAETQPVESALDIYYETSTAGLIQDLNLAIQEGAGAVATPFGITTIDASTWDESQTGSFTITNNFGLLDATNAPFVDINAVASIISVVDGNGNPRHPGEFILNDLGTGYFNISTTKNAGEGYVVLEDDNLTNFSFNISIESQGQTFFKTFIAGINNVRPTYGGNYNVAGGISSYILPKIGGYIFPTDQTLLPSSGALINGNDVFSAVNGTGDATLEKQELYWRLVSAVCVGGKNFTQAQWEAVHNVSWGSAWAPYPTNNPLTCAFISSAVQAANPGQGYNSYQVLEGGGYINTFSWCDLSPGATDPSNTDPRGQTGPGSWVATKWGSLQPAWANVNVTGYGNNKARLGAPRGLKGNGNGNLQFNSAGNQLPGGPGFSDYTPNFIEYLDFLITFRVEDRNGIGLTPTGQDPKLHVRFK